MGKDAKVKIWVGVRSEDCDIEELREKLPRDLFDNEGDEIWKKEDVDRAVEVHGCVPERVRCSEEYAGLGLTVFSHDWDYGAVAFDTAEVQRRIEEESSKLRAMFDKCGIENEIGVWCQTDWR